MTADEGHRPVTLFLVNNREIWLTIKFIRYVNHIVNEEEMITDKTKNDPIRAKWVDRINKIITHYKTKRVPKAYLEGLEVVRDAYATGEIAGESELRSELIDLTEFLMDHHEKLGEQLRAANVTAEEYNQRMGY